MVIGLYRPALSRPAAVHCQCGSWRYMPARDAVPRSAAQSRPATCTSLGDPPLVFYLFTVLRRRAMAAVYATDLSFKAVTRFLCLTISNSLLLDTPTVLKVCETVFFVLPEPREGFNADLVNAFFFFLNGES
ncbi:hypothetical protein Bca4012_004719 [Brassica carinata]